MKKNFNLPFICLLLSIFATCLIFAQEEDAVSEKQKVESNLEMSGYQKAGTIHALSIEEALKKA